MLTPENYFYWEVDGTYVEAHLDRDRVDIGYGVEGSHAPLPLAKMDELCMNYLIWRNQRSALEGDHSYREISMEQMDVK